MPRQIEQLARARRVQPPVEQSKIDGRLAAHEQGPCLGPVRGSSDNQSGPSQHFRQRGSCGGVGLGNQNASATQSWRQTRMLSSLLAARAQGNREEEAAAAPDRALHADAAAHQFDQASADGQAQTRAAETPGRGSVGLGKRAKELRLLRGRKPDTGILDFEEQFDAIRVATAQAHRNVHFALLGELDGVARQVAQNLAKPQGIAEEQHGHVGLARNDQLDILLRRANPDEGGHVIQHVVEREHQMFDLQFGSFDLR